MREGRGTTRHTQHTAHTDTARDMTTLKRRIIHDTLGEITLYGQRDRSRDSADSYGRILLDVEDGDGTTLDREDWMEHYADLVDYLPKFDVGDTVQVQTSHHYPPAHGTTLRVTGRQNPSLDRTMLYETAWVQGPFDGCHLEPTDETPEDAPASVRADNG